jgi:hypothetical protein
MKPFLNRPSGLNSGIAVISAIYQPRKLATIPKGLQHLAQGCPALGGTTLGFESSIFTTLKGLCQSRQWRVAMVR